MKNFNARFMCIRNFVMLIVLLLYQLKQIRKYIRTGSYLELTLASGLLVSMATITFPQFGINVRI